LERGKGRRREETPEVMERCGYNNHGSLYTFMKMSQ
jgi:hypothetical protein